MILVDTSVWVDHLRAGDPHLAELLLSARVLVHPHVTGEIALGSLRDRGTVLGLLRNLPRAQIAKDEDVLDLINLGQLFSRGIGYTDAHLLSSVRLSPGTLLWTRDKRLASLAQEMGLSYAPK